MNDTIIANRLSDDLDYKSVSVSADNYTVQTFVSPSSLHKDSSDFRQFHPNIKNLGNFCTVQQKNSCIQMSSNVESDCYAPVPFWIV